MSVKKTLSRPKTAGKKRRTATTTKPNGAAKPLGASDETRALLESAREVYRASAKAPGLEALEAMIEGAATTLEGDPITAAEAVNAAARVAKAFTEKHATQGSVTVVRDSRWYQRQGRAPRPSPYEGGYRDGMYQPSGDQGDHYIPDHPIENAALRHTRGNEAHDIPVGSLPLGDLVVHATAHRTYLDDKDPEGTTSYESQALRLLAIEMKAAAIVATRQSYCEDHIDFVEGDIEMLLAGLARRAEAIAELGDRFRSARYGDPRHGGYDEEEAKLIADGMPKAKRSDAESEASDG